MPNSDFDISLYLDSIFMPIFTQPFLQNQAHSQSYAYRVSPFHRERDRDIYAGRTLPAFH